MRLPGLTFMPRRHIERRLDLAEVSLFSPVATAGGMLAVLISLATCFSYFAPLAVSVTLDGTVTTAFTDVDVRTQEVGIVRSVLVSEGQAVLKGEVLAILDDRQAKVQLEGARFRLLRSGLAKARLKAQLSGSKEMPPCSDLQQYATEVDRLPELRQVEQENLTSHWSELNVQVQSFVQNATTSEAESDGLLGVVNADIAKVRTLGAELEAATVLQRTHSETLTRVRFLQEAISDAVADFESVSVRRHKAHGEAVEAALQATEVQTHYRALVSEQLSEAERAGADDYEHYLKAAVELEGMSIRSPSNGRVINLRVYGSGVTVGGGEVLLSVSPSDVPKFISARVRSVDIGNIGVGSVARVRITDVSGYERRAQGTVTFVSPDKTVDFSSQASYFAIRVSIPGGPSTESAFRLGSTVRLTVMSGTKTIFRYLTDPLISRLFTTFVH